MTTKIGSIKITGQTFVLTYFDKTELANYDLTFENGILIDRSPTP